MTLEWREEDPAILMPQYSYEELRDFVIAEKMTLCYPAQLDSLWHLCHALPPGDLIECGVWNGGASIIMAHANRVLWNDERRQIGYDSFQGIPEPEHAKYKNPSNETTKPRACKTHRHVAEKAIAKCGFEIELVEGWFKDTLPGYEGEIALLRFDGDTYSSTREVLEELYPKVVPGGVVIIDDYCFASCRQAVHEHLQGHPVIFGNDHVPIKPVPESKGMPVKSPYAAVYWRK